jgi:glycosidase
MPTSRTAPAIAPGSPRRSYSQRDRSRCRRFALEQPRLAIENLQPSVEAGRFAARCVIGDRVRVEVDVFCDGHERLAVWLQWRRCGDAQWATSPMQLGHVDRWSAIFVPKQIGRHEFSILAWLDEYGSFRDGLQKKRAAGVDIALELIEGRQLLARAAAVAEPTVRQEIDGLLQKLASAGAPQQCDLLLSDVAASLAMASGHRPFALQTPAMPLEVERLAARYASWYELFPRSMSGSRERHGRFDDVIPQLPRIRDMGFDVLYFPPIHPIGSRNRKGRNNSLVAEPGDPGSPYAIGSAEGGHDAIHPELGSFEDFRRLRDAAAAHGLELALDFAIQCSPDHPWLKQHPGWFAWRPDGSLKYAENPPKKYQDIVNLDFYAAPSASPSDLKSSHARGDAAPGASPGDLKSSQDRGGAAPGASPGDLQSSQGRGYATHGSSDERESGEAAIPDLWLALRDLVLFWVGEGVKIFRVDNPHTKPLPFWEWLIADVRGRDPDVIFLAEAFTRPTMMYRLGKIGFSQSYTYFTWRNHKQEILDYLAELSRPPVADFYRPHFFVNTPDINPYFLQTSGRPGFLIRAALAATGSGLWGMYSGFELCEAAALPGKEEYLDSEKFELRPRDWNQPGHIAAEIGQLNRIRRGNPALQTHLGFRPYNCWNDQLLYFGKATPQRDNFVLVIICLDPRHPQEADFEIPLWEFGLRDDAALDVEDLMNGQRWRWQGKRQRLRLDPLQLPFAIWRIGVPQGDQR